MKSVTTEIQPSPLSKFGTYLPLIMGNHPDLGEVIINLPNIWNLDITADDEKLDMIHSEIYDFHRVLNLENGELIRSFKWKTKSGAEISCIFKRFISDAK